MPISQPKKQKVSYPHVTEIPDDLSLVNLEYRPKIGHALTEAQASTIQRLYYDILANLTPDETGIYCEAYNVIFTSNFNPELIQAKLVLTPAQQIAISNIYRRTLLIYQLNFNKNASDITAIDQTKLAQSCKQLIDALDLPTPEYQQYQHEQDKQRLQQTKENIRSLSVIRAEPDPTKKRNLILMDLMTKALLDLEQKFILQPEQIEVLRNSMGDDFFQYFIRRYELDVKNLSLDDLRMIIIGIVSHTSEKALKSDFFRHVFLALHIKETGFDGLTSLRIKVSEDFQWFDYTNINLDHTNVNEAIERISHEPSMGIFGHIINLLREWIPLLSFIISERLKINENFKADFKAATIITNVSKWDRTKDHDEHVRSDTDFKIMQSAASDEYLFHIIAYLDFNVVDTAKKPQSKDNPEDLPIIPVIERDGTIEYYRVHNVLDKKGLVCMALVPVAPRKDKIDVKVLFRGTHSIYSALVDFEKYAAGYKSYRNYEVEVLKSLNSIVKQAKADTSKLGFTPKISITAGGHSLGGALTQNLYASFIKIELLPIYLNYQNNPKELEEKLHILIEKQIQYEIQVGCLDSKIYNTEKEIVKLVDIRTQYLIKALNKFYKNKRNRQSLQPSDIAELADLTALDFSILNSAGCAHKVRNMATDGLCLLRSEGIAPDNFPIHFRSIMAGGDVIQQTGETTICAGLKKQNITTETIKIHTPYEGTAFLALLTSIFAIILTAISQTLRIGHLINIPGVPKVDTIIGHVRRAHCEFHFDRPDTEFDRFCNLDHTARNETHELTTKIPFGNCKLFQDLKKSLCSWLKLIYTTFSKARSDRQSEQFIPFPPDSQSSTHIVRQRIEQFERLTDPSIASIATKAQRLTHQPPSISHAVSAAPSALGSPSKPKLSTRKKSLLFGQQADSSVTLPRRGHSPTDKFTPS